ncbi:helix-turn-helix transcriptional regulator [Sagittula salina]|uniref:Shikimate kinase n=1 Tax=Sagittula salina TaxID=2820268 RepID=A0A940S2I1_9RHOB|nr:helix-turn-helix transcriptional regulator [Sagittula salina]MBP0484112.1 helix-turn-helix transcriptional regulator [Sagittula salina]
MSKVQPLAGELTHRGAEAERAVNAVLARVGDRVRRAREARHIPRRVLSEMSGVSPRYLAQLEGGEGNISIGLLTRVALALDLTIDRLVGEEDPWTSETLRVADLFARADRPAQVRVLAALDRRAPEGARAQRLCLVGLRGAGKSTLGRLAGEALGVPFLELNAEIARLGGMPVAEIMALYGAEGYRALEAEAVEGVIKAHERIILAVGGGLVAESATYERVLERFHTVWVKASPEEHMERVRAQGDLRPMAGRPEAMQQLRTILRAREALYERAHAALDTSDATLHESLEALRKLLTRKGFLGPI